LQLGVVVVDVVIVLVVELVVMHASHKTGHCAASGNSVISFLQNLLSSLAQPAGSGLPLQIAVVVVVPVVVVLVAVTLVAVAVVAVVVVAVVVVVVAVADVVVVVVVVLVAVVVGHELHMTGQLSNTASPINGFVQSLAGISVSQSSGSG